MASIAQPKSTLIGKGVNRPNLWYCTKEREAKCRVLRCVQLEKIPFSLSVARSRRWGPKLLFLEDWAAHRSSKEEGGGCQDGTDMHLDLGAGIVVDSERWKDLRG